MRNRRKTLSDARTVLNKRERRIFETRRLAEEQIRLVELAEEFGVSRERVRQIEVSAFEKGAGRSEAPRRRDGDPGASAGALASNLFVSLWVRFTATERRERDAARRVGAGRALDDPRTALCVIGRPSRALQMESYPKFHNEVGVPIVRIGCREFKCIGDKPPQDHPHIYLKMGDAGEIVCPYCSTLFRFDPSLGAQEAYPAGCAYGDRD
jgi:uncharacterized Zn-finger protein